MNQKKKKSEQKKNYHYGYHQFVCIVQAITLSYLHVCAIVLSIMLHIVYIFGPFGHITIPDLRLDMISIYFI